MDRILQRLFPCVFLLFASIGLHAQSAYTVMAVGEVKAVNREAGTVTLDHGPLLNLNIGASVRIFQVADRAFLEGVKIGDAMKFIADNVSGRLTIIEVETGPTDGHGAH